MPARAGTLTTKGGKGTLGCCTLTGVVFVGSTRSCKQFIELDTYYGGSLLHVNDTLIKLIKINIKKPSFPSLSLSHPRTKMPLRR